MSFIESASPDITEGVPTHISARPPGSPVYSLRTAGVLSDITIDNMSFRLAISDQNPYIRETADFRRQQVDTAKEPGEQTLNQWWVRSLDSWHRGAGIRWYEPGSDELTVNRYERSIGLDVWTKGQVSLVKKMETNLTATVGQTCYATGGRVGGTNVIFTLKSGVLTRHDGTTGTAYSGGSPSTEPVIAGSKVLSGSLTGILAGDVSGSTLTALWTTTTTVLRPWWVKSRIIAAQGAALYQLTLAGGALSGQTPLYTHPSSTFTWTGVTETANAIIAAGHDGGYGYVFRISITDPGNGGSPVLSPPIQIADFPPGEEVHSVKGYLSTYLAIGTSRGVRIGIFDGNNFQYGPLILTTTQPVRALGARDSYIFAGIQDDLDGRSGCARIDLSESIEDLRYAWAYDAMAPGAGQVDSVAFLGVSSRVVLGVLGQGVFLQSSTLYESAGYFLTGRIRYGTSEPKSFNFLKVRASIGSDTSVPISTVSATETVESLLTLSSSWNTDEDITLRTISDRGQSHAAIRVGLNASTDSLATPLIQSIQIKALPQPRIQRNIRYPLMLEDQEQDRRGNRLGKTGQAGTRLFALEALESEHAIVQIRDSRTGEAYAAQIRSIQYVNDTPPSKNRTNFGGVAQVTVLKL